MPVNLKRVKKELQTDISKVGKTPDGDYKFTPPNIVGRRVNKYPKLKVTKVKIEPDLKNEKLKTTGLVASEEKTSMRYKVTIHFFGVPFREIETAQFNNLLKTGRGRGVKSYYHRNIAYGKNDVVMRCSCMDFRHRFQKPLRDAGGLYGGFIGYTRKTDPWPIGRPFANSTEKLGICKHISSFLSYLEGEGILKNR